MDDLNNREERRETSLNARATGAGNDDTTVGDEIGEAVGGISGVLTGAALGSLGGPIGTIIGGIAGAVSGWWAGRAISEAASHVTTEDEDYYRTHYEGSSTRLADRSYEDVRPAYQIGHLASRNPDYSSRPFDEVESDLRRGWTNDVSARHGSWDQVRDYARHAYDRGRTGFGTGAVAGAAAGTAAGAASLGHKAADKIDDVHDRLDGNPASRPGPDATDRPGYTGGTSALGNTATGSPTPTGAALGGANTTASDYGTPGALSTPTSGSGLGGSSMAGTGSTSATGNQMGSAGSSGTGATGSTGLGASSGMAAAGAYGSDSVRSGDSRVDDRAVGNMGNTVGAADLGSNTLGSTADRAAAGTENLGHRLADRVDDLKDRVDGNPASRPGPDATDRPSYGAHTPSTGATGLNAADRATERTRSAGETLGDKAENAWDRTKQGVENLGHRAADAVDNTKDRIDGNPASRPGPDATDRR